MHKQRLIIIAVAVVGLISIFLPWATAEGWGETDTANGLNDLFNGMFALIGFAAAAGLAFVGDQKKPVTDMFKWGVVAAGALAAIIALIDLLDIMSTDATGFGIDYDPSFGLFLTLIAGVVIAAVPLVLGKE